MRSRSFLGNVRFENADAQTHRSPRREFDVLSFAVRRHVLRGCRGGVHETPLGTPLGAASRRTPRLHLRQALRDWALGGGTVLMLHYAHRTSRDIDVFLKDAQALPLLSPRLNDRAAGLARDHVEASNFVKLACTDGEIDFIVAPDLTERPRETRALGGREIAVETPVEIVVKKAFYRAADLRARDLFDLAVVIDRARADLDRSAGVLASKRDVLRARVRTVTPRYRASAAREIALLPAGEPYLERAPDVVQAFVDALPG